jgi:uncharacterized protein YcaQ
MLSTSWNQVTTWRLSQHHLLEPADPQQLQQVVTKIGGAHAQLMSAAELALSARVRNLSPGHVQAALWTDRTLVKTWAKRGTLHLLAASEFPLYVAALSTYRHFRRGSWLKHHGVTLDELEAIIEAVRDRLQGEGMTRDQLADGIVQRTGKPQLKELLGSGWGALLKPAAFQGYLCYGPDQGRNVTFVAPDKWLGKLSSMDPEQAWQVILRRYLSTYGPATVDDFGRWWGLEPSRSKRLFRALGGEIEEVDVEGWQAWALALNVEPMQALQAPNTVRLLPAFDPYVNSAYRHCQHLLPEGKKSRIYRAQGWVSPVVLVNGRMEGVWGYDKQRSQVVVTVEMFAPPTARIQRGAEAEAQRLGRFLDTDIKLMYA